jgi:hypothetical protein
MRNGFAENFILYAFKKNYEKTSLRRSKHKNMMSTCIHTNLCKRNYKVVYKYEGIWSFKGCVRKLLAY